MTKWHCESCDTRGFINHDAHAGVFDVYTRITEAHRVASPKCEHGDKIIIEVIKSVTTSANPEVSRAAKRELLLALADIAQNTNGSEVWRQLFATMLDRLEKSPTCY